MTATPACPFCDGTAVERVGRWGGQMITSQWRCRSCATYFEAIREDFSGPEQELDEPGGAGAGDRLEA